ncbi:MAG: hypothetical protein J6S53_01155 [Lentisphaeria bacterium]|nr:hypothetical protein [Lentisphaeria bacterium]
MEKSQAIFYFFSEKTFFTPVPTMFPAGKPIRKQFINKLLTSSALIPQDHTINFTPSLKIVKAFFQKNEIFIFHFFSFCPLYFSKSR